MRFTLTPGWWCWIEEPPARPGWGTGPVFIVKIEPLKSGHGLLRLRVVQPMHPIAGRVFDVALLVLARSAEFMVGLVRDEDDVERRVTIRPPDFALLETQCPALMRRRPRGRRSMSDWLRETFGDTPSRILHGATTDAFGSQHPRMPRRHGTFRLDLTCAPFESWLVARGFVPQSMDDRWFVAMAAGRLLVRRSWTLRLVFDVAAAWEGERLLLGEVRVNRSKAEFKADCEDTERRLLHVVLAGVLLGEHHALAWLGGYTAEHGAMLAKALLAEASP
jgi:hypothetical protein